MKLASHSKLRFYGGLVVVDGLFFGLTDPSEVSSWLLIVGFGLFIISLFVIARLVLKTCQLAGLPVNPARRTLKLFTIGSVAALALISGGQLGSHELMVLLPLLSIAYLYVVYGLGKPKARQPISTRVDQVQ